MDDKVITLLESINKRLETIEEKVDRNHKVALDGIKHHGEDITYLKEQNVILNEKIDEMMIILLKRGGYINLKDILKQNL